MCKGRSEGKNLCSEIPAGLINTGCAQLIDSEMAEHRVRQLQITQTVVRTHQIYCGAAGKCDSDTGIALKDEFIGGGRKEQSKISHLLLHSKMLLLA